MSDPLVRSLLARMRILERKVNRFEKCVQQTTERSEEMHVQRTVEQTLVDIPFPTTQEEMVHTPTNIQQECAQQCTIEQLVDVPDTTMPEELVHGPKVNPQEHVQPDVPMPVPQETDVHFPTEKKGKITGDTLQREDTLRPGSKVQVSGLTNSKELNGLTGHLLHFDEEKHRWGVHLDTGKKVLLKSDNLKPLLEPATSNLNVETSLPVGPITPGAKDEQEQMYTESELMAICLKVKERTEFEVMRALERRMEQIENKMVSHVEEAEKRTILAAEERTMRIVSEGFGIAHLSGDTEASQNALEPDDREWGYSDEDWDEEEDGDYY